MKKPKQDPGKEIDNEKYFRAQTHWVTFWGQQGIEIPNFSKFLGLTRAPILHRRAPNKINTLLMFRASVVKKIEKLSSPHWYTILKAYQIRKNKHDR